MNSDQQLRKFPLKFSIFAVIVSILITLLITVLVYGLVRTHLLNNHAQALEQRINLLLSNEKTNFKSAESVKRLLWSITQQPTSQQSKIQQGKTQQSKVKYAGLYDQNNKMLLSFPAEVDAPNLDNQTLQKVMSAKQNDALIEPNLAWYSLEGLSYKPRETEYFKLINADNRRKLILRVVSDASDTYSAINELAIKIMLCVYLLLLSLILLLFWLSYRARKAIDHYKNDLERQVQKLSEALDENQSLQTSMRTASSRAIELNEQFLRKIGADLHDGPAQSISYAVLGLDKVNQADDNSSVFNQQYHSVKEALAYSVEEIRTIAAGLVLPQIENLSLTESIIKVINLHQKNSTMEVNHFFKNLPDFIPIPVKICAYRFVQESLNNANRHGKAESCRVSVSYANSQLQIIIKDNGKGFKVGEQKMNDEHLGLLGLQDRIESMGGKFVMKSKLGVGSSMKVNIPI